MLKRRSKCTGCYSKSQSSIHGHLDRLIFLRTHALRKFETSLRLRTLLNSFLNKCNPYYALQNKNSIQSTRQLRSVANEKIKTTNTLFFALINQIRRLYDARHRVWLHCLYLQLLK
uniref:Uncharacterized protein n=1 Tax=Lepeophtheirus salmonis TaxID=72036 RepID=A0A0K2V8F1_LEPSM